MKKIKGWEIFNFIQVLEKYKNLHYKDLTNKAIERYDRFNSKSKTKRSNIWGNIIEKYTKNKIKDQNEQYKHFTGVEIFINNNKYFSLHEKWKSKIEYNDYIIFKKNNPLDIVLKNNSNKNTLSVETYSKIEKTVSQELEKDGDNKPNKPGEYRDGYAKFRVNHKPWADQLKNFYKMCAVCGVDEWKLLIASHILPWSKSNDIQKTDQHNGIVLCVAHDKLFELNYISFDSKGFLICNKLIKEYDSFYNVSENKIKKLSKEKTIKLPEKYNKNKVYDYIEKKNELKNL